MTLRKIYFYGLVCGIIPIILACLVMYGWHSGSQSLVQINPAFAPMQYNTAIGFLLCGMGLVALFLRKRNLSSVLGLMALCLGAATLLQYIIHVDFGIDELFVDPVFITKTTHPGRMAPMTALCFSVSGLGLFGASIKRALGVGVSVSLLVLAMMVLAGYLAPQDDDLYGWGNLARMALHTASGFVFVGSGFLFYSLGARGSQRFDFWQIAPFSIAMVVAILTFFSWYIIDEQGRTRNNAYLQGLIKDTQSVLTDRYRLYENTLRGSVGLYYASDSVKRTEWKNYVRALNPKQNLPGINGVGYIDYVLAQNLATYLDKVRSDNAPDFQNHPDTFYPDKFIIKFIEPSAENAKAIGLDIGFEANRRAAAERARDLGVPALTKKILLVQDNKKQAGFLLLLPVYDTKDKPDTIEARRAHFKGWVYAPFIGPNFFKDVSAVNKNQLYLEVFDGVKTNPEALIYADPDYGHDETHTGYYSGKIVETQMKIAGRVWTLEWHVNENYTPPANTKTFLWFLLFGLIFSVFLYFALDALLRSKEVIRKKVEEKTAELKQSSDFQDLITKTIPDFLFVKDAEFKIIDANDAFLSLYPEDMRAGIIGTTTVESYDPQEAEMFLEQDRIAFEKGYTETVETIVFPNGLPATLLTKKVRFEDAKGKSFILGISRDITEVQKAQQDIIRANIELERSNHELKRFAYIASHDLQEPLRKIGGFTDRLEQHLAEQLKTDEKAKTYMGFVTSGVDRMRDLIMGLLQYSSVTTSEFDIQRLDANQIVTAAIENLSEMIAENEAQILFSDLPEVGYDKVMLTQLFQNLIGNAIKYRSESPPEICIGAKRNGKFWEFSVADNGLGIEDKYLEQIFEMFKRLHRKEDVRGTGIGLSLCQKIVERYGGTIWVTSEIDVGSIFYFTVPVQEVADENK